MLLLQVVSTLIAENVRENAKAVQMIELGKVSLWDGLRFDGAS